MLTIFERSVFRQFLVINAIYFCVIMGLFVVIDLFDNMDEFLKHSNGGGFVTIFVQIVIFYSRKSMFIFDAAAVPLIAISILTMLLLLQRKGQIKPFLSAGIPAYRILVPALLCGTLVMVGIKIFNREVMLGNSMHHLHAGRGKAETLHDLVPRYDHASQILIDGASIYPERNIIEEAMFVLPQEIAGNDLVCLKAPEAQFYPQQGSRPSGWLLRKPNPPLSEIPLTKQGQHYLRGLQNTDSIFVVSDVTPDLIYKAKDASSFLSTSHLLFRIKSPAIDAVSAREMEFNLHARVVEPLLLGLMVWIAIPVILQKESRGVLIAAFRCGVCLFTIIGSTYAVRFLASAQMAEPIQAAWLPLFVVTPLTVWMLDRVET